MKGYFFEYFILKLLKGVGFTSVKSDGIKVWDGPPGQMVAGLGSYHDADVLLNPPLQNPFYIPTRLLVECKNYANRVGLPIVRGL
jgi:hypothetical protein